MAPSARSRCIDLADAVVLGVGALETTGTDLAAARCGHDTAICVRDASTKPSRASVLEGELRRQAVAHADRPAAMPVPGPRPWSARCSVRRAGRTGHGSCRRLQRDETAGQRTARVRRIGTSGGLSTDRARVLTLCRRRTRKGSGGGHGVRPSCWRYLGCLSPAVPLRRWEEARLAGSLRCRPPGNAAG